MTERKERDTQSPGVSEKASAFVDRQEAYRRYVQVGLDAAARGDVRDWDEVEAELIQKYGDFDD